jgi:hypothetical protein
MELGDCRRQCRRSDPIVMTEAFRDQNGKPLVDDAHHPACQGNDFISDMLLHAIYSNWEIPNNNQHDTHPQSATTTCRDDLTQHKYRQPKAPNKHPLLWATHTTEKEYQELWKDLFQLDTKVGSITPWEPRVHNQTNLHMRNRQEIATWPFALTDNSVPERQDLKQGFVLPTCSSQRRLVLQVDEPHLKWIGLDIGTQNKNLNINTNTNLQHSSLPTPTS